jgi:hypothetical protein
MTTDFKASQVQTNRLIATGSFAGGSANQILVYSIDADSPGSPNQGQIDPSAFDVTSGIGSDVLLFVSGGIGQARSPGSYAVSVFGGDTVVSGVLYGSTGQFSGDFVVSGTLYAERQVIEVDELATGSLLISGNLIVSQSVNSGQGLFVNVSNESGYGIAVGGDGSFVNRITGSLEVTNGLSGSLTHLTDGSSYLVAGSNILITSQSNGSILIEGTASPTSAYWFERSLNRIFTTGSVEITGSFTQGANSVSATGLNSHAQGLGTSAQGNNSHAEGSFTVASGDSSHAEGGQLTAASGQFSHAEGFGTLAGGTAAHSEGQNTVALGSYSHSEGLGTIASGSHQHVQGKYNLRNNDFSLFVIGDGVGTPDPQRGDIVRVNSGSAPGLGRVEITGSLSVSGSNGRLEVGKIDFTLGPDVGFFVSGNVGGKGSSGADIGVFGGDLVISGNTHFLAGMSLYVTQVISTTPAYTASLTDYVVAVSASLGSGITLPSSPGIGKTYIIKDVSGSAAADNIIISGTNGELIDGQLGETIAIDHGSIQVVYFGSPVGWGVV